MDTDEMQDDDIEGLHLLFGDEREDSIETAEHARENAPHADAWELTDQARSIIARIAVVTGADAEDLVGKKAVLNSWAEDVDTILDILNIKWLGIPSVDDPRLGKWYLVPISPEVADALVTAFSEAARSKASGKYMSDEWVISRNRIRSEMISDFLEAAVKERLRVDQVPGPEETPDAAAEGASAVADVDVADYDFDYTPKYDKELILSFAEMCGAREDAATEYRFYEDIEFREERIRQILAHEYFPPAENLDSHFSNDSIELYEGWYVRAITWFQEVLPGLLGDVDHFPPYNPPVAGTVDLVEPAAGQVDGAGDGAVYAAGGVEQEE